MAAIWITHHSPPSIETAATIACQRYQKWKLRPGSSPSRSRAAIDPGDIRGAPIRRATDKLGRRRLAHSTLFPEAARVAMPFGSGSKTGNPSAQPGATHRPAGVQLSSKLREARRLTLELLIPFRLKLCSARNGLAEERQNIFSTKKRGSSGQPSSFSAIQLFIPRRLTMSFSVSWRVGSP